MATCTCIIEVLYNMYHTCYFKAKKFIRSEFVFVNYREVCPGFSHKWKHTCTLLGEKEQTFPAGKHIHVYMNSFCIIILLPNPYKGHTFPPPQSYNSTELS